MARRRGNKGGGGGGGGSGGGNLKKNKKPASGGGAQPVKPTFNNVAAGYPSLDLAGKKIEFYSLK